MAGEAEKYRMAQFAMRKVDPAPCPLGCGKMIMPHFMQQHVDHACMERIKPSLAAGMSFGVAGDSRHLNAILTPFQRHLNAV